MAKLIETLTGMKLHASIFCCAALLCCGRAETAELLGSPVPEIRQNFKRLITTNACPGCNLQGVVLNRLDLSEASLEGADLSGAKMGMVSLVKAKLRNAKLRGAWLGGANLTDADLTGADLTGVDFTTDGGKAVSRDPGQQAAAAAQDTVNTMLSDIFSALQQKVENAAAADQAAPPQLVPDLPGQTKEKMNKPGEENNIQTAAAAQKNSQEQPKQSVEEIPVMIFWY